MEYRLVRLFSRHMEHIHDFIENQPEVWTVIDASYLSAETLIKTFATKGELDRVGVHKLMLWQTILGYQANSAMLLIGGALDEGQALLRMAIETTRDVARIGRSNERLQLWLDSRGGNDEKALEQFRKKFVFHTAKRWEGFLYKTYNFLSGYGVHGHFLTSGECTPIQQNPDKTVSLDVPAHAVYERLEMWLRLFYPIHELCIQTFPSIERTDDPQIKEMYRLYLNSKLATYDFIPILSANIKAYKEDDNGPNTTH